MSLKVWQSGFFRICEILSDSIYPLPNNFNKFLDWSKWKGLAGNKKKKEKLTEKQNFFDGWLGNIMGKGDNAGCQQCFQGP